MAKYCGQIGFGSTSKTAPGVQTLIIVEHTYYGDVIEDVKKWENSEQMNDNLNVMNKISILADTFAIQNLDSMRYATFMGVKWKIRSVSVSFPRMILSLGGVYNDQES